MAETAAATLLIEQRDEYLSVLLNRPGVRNAVNLEMVEGLHEVCRALEQDPQPLVLSGAGDFFAAGADIAELSRRGPLEALAGINSRVFDRVAGLPMPTLAVVNGPAIGGGAELAYACDLRIATDTATFANPEVGLGIIAAAGACWRLRELVGLPTAKAVLLGGLTLDAESALRHGLVLEVVGEDEVPEAVDRLMRRVLRSSPTALRLTKLAVGAPREAHPLLDDVAQAVAFGSEDKDRRMVAFLHRKTTA